MGRINMKTVYTIGYEGTDIDRFVQTLKAVGVQSIADVRAVPLSRKKGFSKNVLRDRLAQEGIAYLPMQDLGDPKAGREAAKAGNYDLFRKIYSSYIDQPNQVSVVADLADKADDSSTCLLCFERDPKTCHRLIVGEKMAMYGYQMMHLYADDPSRYIRNRERLTARAEGLASHEAGI
jgi:uncharacterized protein (DUF488 family)